MPARVEEDDIAYDEGMQLRVRRKSQSIQQTAPPAALLRFSPSPGRPSPHRPGKEFLLLAQNRSGTRLS